MLNQVVLAGNLGADPEVFYSEEGSPIASFNLAFRSSKTKTGWIKVSCFKKVAEIAEKHLHKGAKIAVVGVLEQHKWEADGVAKSTLQLIANNIEFIKTDGRGFSDNQEGGDIPF